MFAATTLIDVAIAATMLEAAALVVYHWRTGAGIAPRELLPNLGAGLFLMLAARLTVGDVASPVLAACFTAAGVAHGIDIRGRWKSSRQHSSQGA